MNTPTLLRKTIPPVYFLAALIIMVLLAYIIPVAQFTSVPTITAGCIMIISGLIITATGAWCFKRADTPMRPFEQATTLVTTGIFRYTRNPMYLGMLCILTGVWIALGKLSPLFVIPIFLFVIQEGFVKPEEKILEKIFGDQYLQYSANVRRWL